MNYSTHASLSSIENIFRKSDNITKSMLNVGLLALTGPLGFLLAKHFNFDSKIYEYFTNDSKEVTQQEKEKLLQEALKKQNAILKGLNEKEKLSNSKIKELVSVQKQLLAIISKLENDLVMMKK